MKTKLQVQYKNINIDMEEMERVVKESVKSRGIKMNMIDTLQLYYQPEDLALYYVVTLKSGEMIRNDVPVYMGEQSVQALFLFAYIRISYQNIDK